MGSDPISRACEFVVIELIEPVVSIEGEFEMGSDPIFTVGEPVEPEVVIEPVAVGEFVMGSDPISRDCEFVMGSDPIFAAAVDPIFAAAVLGAASTMRT